MPKKKAPTDLTKREKFENAGRFPVKKAAIIGAIVMVVAVGSFVGDSPGHQYACGGRPGGAAGWVRL